MVGGWSEFQFAERRDADARGSLTMRRRTPVFVQHLYRIRALLNRAALKAVGYTKETPDPAGGEIVRDGNGNPTGMLDCQTQRDDPLLNAGQGPKLPWNCRSTQRASLCAS